MTNQALEAQPFSDNTHLQNLRENIRQNAYLAEENCVGQRLASYPLNASLKVSVSEKTAKIVEELRKTRQPELMEKFLGEYGLNTEEGVALMCLAEAYLRTPDAENLDALISDKIGGGDWARHIGKARSSLVNASTWALMLTGKVFRTIPAETTDLSATMHNVVRQLGEPVARRAVGEAMKILGQQFVLGTTIEKALANAETGSKKYDQRYSFDMLGEAARTAKDAERYFLSYGEAISEIAKKAKADFVHDNPGISVKLSALHPRYETTQKARVIEELVPRVLALAQIAAAANIGFAIDAEECDRLDLSLDVIERVLSSKSLEGWDGFGVVVQAYTKRAPFVLDWLEALASHTKRKISVRLVKGAYWDAEIKNSQVLGLSGYPVYTRKQATDVSYLVCAKKLLDFAASETPRIYPQFATHNAHTVCAINALADENCSFEFQRLHGMGETLHHESAISDKRPRRVYAPVGIHEDLLAYLVRRLLENGANSSFVNQLLDPSVDPADMGRDPADELAGFKTVSHPAIVLPKDIYAAEDKHSFVRENSMGWNINDPVQLNKLVGLRDKHAKTIWDFSDNAENVMESRNPANRDDLVGKCKKANAEDVARAIDEAKNAFANWAATSCKTRSEILQKTAKLMEDNTGELIAMTTREAGKTLLDGIAELREAVDFLRYYAAQIDQDAAYSDDQYAPAGLIGCISPWNFPVAIFTGQIAAALAAGNCVIAKPSEQTPLVAERVSQLFFEAGLPKGVLQMVQGDGHEIGPALNTSKKLDGVAFTGSTDTARMIDMDMAKAGNPEAGLIAETGGLNAMIVDSTALPEQAVRDIVMSAFQSAGQRCSALRLLCVQKDIAPKLLTMLQGATKQLVIDNPWNPATDIGPLIDEKALQRFTAYCKAKEEEGALLFAASLPDELKDKNFLAPQCIRLDSVSDLKQEIFGPVLHVVEFDGTKINDLIEEINGLGFGLTLGVHSRIDTRIDQICDNAHIGNIYVNRNQIGAIVGVQPFGGEGLSGTGPKAGGPVYVTRFGKFSNQDHAQMSEGEKLALVGPTGERNTYSTFARGHVLCVAKDEGELESLKNKAEQSGNTTSTHLLSETNADWAKLLENESPDCLLIGELPKDSIRGLRTLLAEQKGPRVPVFNANCAINLLRSEKVISEDTTASGGNASLLSAVG